MSLELVKDGGMEPTQPLIVVDAPQPIQYLCLNGPCQGSRVDAPSDATTGTACALPWQSVKGKPQFAVYILVDYNGQRGLMYIKSYQRPDYAQAQVERLTALCAAGVS